MVESSDDELVFRFPEVHSAAVCRIGFQRTLRIPDDNRDYPLPPGLGLFPLRRVDDHLDRAPDGRGRHGGVFLPMYQAEALWLHFGTSYPMAMKVAAGKVDAVTGEGWTDELSPRPQNYVAAMKLKKGEGVLADNAPVQPTGIRADHADRVREGEF